MEEGEREKEREREREREGGRVKELEGGDCKMQAVCLVWIPKKHIITFH